MTKIPPQKVANIGIILSVVILLLSLIIILIFGEILPPVYGSFIILLYSIWLKIKTNENEKRANYNFL
jgi:hypothetical protein